MSHMSSKKSKGSEAIKKLKAMDKGKVMASLMGEMKSVDAKSEKAKLNETSIEDSEGRRITYIITEDMIKAKKGK